MLDPELIGAVLDVVKSLADDGITMIIVTHEMSFIRDVSNKIIFMDEGRIILDEHPRSFLMSQVMNV